MKTSIQFPFRLQWTVQDLVDAIPLRLSEMAAFTTIAGAHGENDNRFDVPSRRELRGRHLPEQTGLPLFRVRN
ncbi:MAG: hypothetical protein ACREPV_07460 [Lysobacter sp.]